METMDQEVLELMSGEELYNNFRKLIGVKDQYLIPFIVKDLVVHPAEVIKKINTGGGEANNLMGTLIYRAKIAYVTWILNKMVSEDNNPLIPKIVKELKKLGIEIIDKVIAGGEQAEDIINNIISQIE